MNDNKCCGRTMMIGSYYSDKRHSVLTRFCTHCGRVVCGGKVVWLRGRRSA